MHKVKNPKYCFNGNFKNGFIKSAIVVLFLNLSFDFVLNCRLSTLNKNTHFKSVYC